MITRIFGRLPADVTPNMIAGHLHAAGLRVEPHFRGDDLGWTGGTLQLPGPGSAVQLERFLTTEDELRADLNNFAADLETMDYNPNHTMLMQHVIQTQQLFAIRRPLDHPDEAALESLNDTLAQYLARQTDGVYQVDGDGWFAADGELLIPEY